AQYEALKPLVKHAAGKTMRCDITMPFCARRVRVVLCERYGEEPMLCGRAMLGIGEKIYPLAFTGRREVMLMPGLELKSDPVEVSVTSGETLELWLYYGGKSAPRALTILPAGYSKEGDHCGQDFPIPRRFGDKLAALQGARCYARLEAETDDEAACSIVAFGDSITSMGLWTGPFERRLSERGGPALFNMGIGGNRLLLDTSIPLLKETQIFGRAALTRFSWDVAPLSGARAVMIELGVNDISQPGGKKRHTPEGAQRCTAPELILGFLELVSLCKAQNLKTVGCTITPFGGYLTHNEATERIRNEANDWILHGGAFDLTADFASAVCDPQKQSHMLPAYDSGDHIHPSRLGGEKMAEAVDLSALLALIGR
ncbi:MAG: GDSL-type esterase/lipase family protein, partial [Eubacteriales bacterium]|nr:GDSL-type esterase/lipase family protein [Eubacteriales bacterium]